MITRADIDALSRLTGEKAPIISLFLRVDKERIDEDYTIRLKNVIRHAEESIGHGYDSDQERAIQADLQRIREFFRDEGDRFGEGVAVFASTPSGIWQVFEVPSDVETHLTIGSRAEVAPLIQLLEELEPFCTCLISRDRARIFWGQMGEIHELTGIIDEDVPGQHEQGGWSQARYERHIEEHVRGHFKRVADSLFQLYQERPFRQLVLGGTNEVVAGFVENLHQYLRDRHVGTVHLLMESNINDVHRESSEIIQRWVSGEKSRYLNVLRNEALSGDLGVVGIDDTLGALQNGQVMSLLVNEGFQAPGAICSECHALQRPSNPEETQCSFCGGQLERRDNIIPNMLTEAFRQDADVVCLNNPDHQDRLRDLGEIGAVLRYRLPPSTEQ